MRAREFINEGRTGTLQADVASSLPASYVIPKLQNTDPYKQYRFGLAIADAKSSKDRSKEQTEPFEKTSAWGENAIVVSYDPHIDDWLDDALNLIGLSSSDKKMISTRNSDEAKDVTKQSPVAKPKKNKYGV